MARKLKEEFMVEEAFYKPFDPESEPVKRLMAYLIEEHRMAIAAYDEYFQELRLLRRAIKAKPAIKVKTFPWPGASNFVAPIIRIAGDAVKARIVNTLLGPQPFWMVTATSSTYTAYAKPWEKFLEWARKNDLDLPNVVEQISDQVVYFGKCPVKIHWVEVIKKILTYDTKTKKRVSLIKKLKDQPCATPIQLENWLEPWGIEPANEKPWNSHRVFMRAGDILEREKNGLASNGKKIVENCLKALPEDMQESDALRKLAWAETRVITLYETHVSFDIDDDGFREELTALWDYESGLPIRVTSNFFFHGQRPVECLYYYRDSDNRSSGEGLAQLLWQIQEAITSFINQRADNITIANTRFWKGRKGSGIKKGEQIWPGKMMLLDNPDSDLIPEKLGDVSPSSFTHESLLRDYGERLSGISDPQLGREFDNPRVAATTTLSVLQEGNRRFDMVIRLMRNEFSKIGIRISQLYQQFKPRVDLSEILSPEDEIYVREILSMSPEEVEKNFIIQVNPSTASSNKESQRQGLLALHNLITGFYGQVLNIAMQVMVNPQMPDQIKDMVVELARSSYNILKEVVQSYDISNPDEFLVDVAAALDFVRQGGSPMQIQQDFQLGMESFAGRIPQQGPTVEVLQEVVSEPNPNAQSVAIA